MSIHHRTAGTTEIVSLAGRLTLGEASSTLREWIRGAIELKADVLVDLSPITYVDSAGLGELVASYDSNRGWWPRNETIASWQPSGLGIRGRAVALASFAKRHILD
ncbi:MAG TPA: STAS domain-containing protein [Bryobacteraceae bacterium]|nr:STAS domain-containing protein [Bryobacteraceae bacterium]